MVHACIMSSASSLSPPPRTRWASPCSRFFLRQSRAQWPTTPQYLHVSFDVPGFPAPRAELPSTATARLAAAASGMAGGSTSILQAHPREPLLLREE